MNKTKFVEIYKLQDDGSQRVISTCRMGEDRALCEGEQPFTENLEKEGIRDYSDASGKILFPKDGLKFLEQLSNNFHSGYVNASGIKEE